MVTLRELELPGQPFHARTQTLSNEHAQALLKLEESMGVKCWEIVPEKPKNATTANGSKGQEK